MRSDAPNAAATSPPTTVSSEASSRSEQSPRRRRSERRAARGIRHRHADRRSLWPHLRRGGRRRRRGRDRGDRLGDRGRAAAASPRAASAASSAARRSTIARCSAASAASRAACSCSCRMRCCDGDLAGRRLDAHGLGRLGRLGEDAEGLLQSHRVALGVEVLPAAQPARQEVRDPERGGRCHEHATADHVHATTLGHGGRMARLDARRVQRSATCSGYAAAARSSAGMRAASARHPSVAPAAQHARRHLLGDEREREVVAPVAVDVDEPPTEPLVAEAELLDHAQRRLVLGADADLHAVQAQHARSSSRWRARRRSA